MPPWGILSNVSCGMRSAADSSQATRIPSGAFVVGVGGLDQQGHGREPLAVAVPHLVEAVVAEAHQVEGDALP